MDTFSGLLSDATELLDDAIALRRDLHAHPELGLELPRTQQAIVEALQPLNLEISMGAALSSVTAILDTGRPGPTVLLRADMDALPMDEDTVLDFKSTVQGAMHACGHDTHVAMLVQAAHLLVARRDDLIGKVVFMFQPGEEGHGGAAIMLEEGILEATAGVDLAFAIHATPSIPSGAIATKGGTIMASSDEFVIDVVGRGGHASTPFQALDPIPIACEIVLATQSMVTRSINAFDPAVVTVAEVKAGTTSNVIPETARLHGTIRAVSARTRGQVHENLERVANGVAHAHGARVDFDLRLGYPVTVNDQSIATWCRAIAADLLGAQLSFEMPAPVMGAEDFSYVLEKVPGALVFLGMCPAGLQPHEAPPNHSNRMLLEESAMANGIALYAGVALAKSAEVLAETDEPLE
jgi:hippurate hydrolase